MTAIQWTDRVWNPVSGCTKVSKGCQHCYAERQADRKLPKGGFTDRPFTEVRCHPNRLDIPLHWRKSQRVFVNSMSDLFHEDVPDPFILAVFSVMERAPQHTFQVLTKRAERMKQVTAWVGRKLIEAGDAWPLRNVWLGVSVEDQATANERIPLLLETPAALRWVSYEPALGPIEFREQWMHKQGCPSLSDWAGGLLPCSCASRRDALSAVEFPRLDWIVVGGESGPGARPFDVQWARSTVEQCRGAGVPVFVKQLGANPAPLTVVAGSVTERLWLRDRKGGDIEEWPEDLRIREFPEVRT